jgi:hypothetical protein
MSRKFIYISVLTLSLILSKTLAAYGQHSRKEVEALRTAISPKIDGLLDESCWDQARSASDFIQMSPYNGSPAVNDTEVKVLFDDHALYFGAIMYDPSPDSVRSFLSLRDDMADSDNIGVSFNPFDDGILSYHFILTAAGVQVDMRSSASGGSNGFDRNWDVVWESAVKTHENGWVAELKIPFSALRFPTNSTKGWGFNIIRVDKRKPEQTSWNFIDSKIPGFDTQMGLLTGITGVETPVRLSFTPYVAGYLTKQTGLDKAGYSFKGGLDLKYGLNDSYTLDMMLIPDFGEVQSDEEILNLTPYEVQYDEKRQFFTEGGDLFGRADIFYSRRIGSRPVNHGDVYDELEEHEIVETNPIETQIINASKITGKSKNGLSLGFLNAMTSASFAGIKDTITGTERSYQTQGFTNYNVTVLDQSLKNNSFLSLINTNVSMAGGGYGANVTGIHTKLANKSNTYAVFFKGGYSHNRRDEITNGAYYDVNLAKIKGNFQFNLNQLLKSDTYDPNALGYERIRNIFSNEVSMEYNIYEPFWRLMEWHNYFSLEYVQQYKPLSFFQMEISAMSSATFRNYLNLELSNRYSPRANDYHEPRKSGLYFRRPAMNVSSVELSSDDRKKLSASGEYSFGHSREYSLSMHELSFSPVYRFNHRFLMEYEIDYSYSRNDLGFAGLSATSDSVFFSNRNLKTLENNIDLVYSFSNKATLRFTARHYWSRLEHNGFYSLIDGGYLEVNPYFTAKNLNFNLFNIDMLYSWEFAPGSTFSIVYKNAIQNRSNSTGMSFFRNFRETLDSPQINSLSVKILYYLDYQYLKRKS